jgi:hypothetical protein
MTKEFFFRSHATYALPQMECKRHSYFDIDQGESGKERDGELRKIEVKVVKKSEFIIRERQKNVSKIFRGREINRN